MKPPIEYRPVSAIQPRGVLKAIAAHGLNSPETILAHKRALKAAQMRRWRAKRKAKK